MASDARVRYTRMVIIQSFINLLKTKSVNRITVKEICEMAEINRATFYKHYLDVYDLLEKIENQFLDELEEILSDRESSTVKEVLTFIMVSFKAQEDTYKAVCSPNGDSAFPAKVFDVCYHFAQPQSQIHIKTLSHAQREWLYQFIAHGCNGVLTKWISEGMKEPISEVADFTERLINNALTGL